MKKQILTGLLAISISSFGMTLESKGIQNGYINDKYGSHGEEFINGMPSLSLPLEWKDAPKETKDYAIVIKDHDAIPVTGFTWIHWAVVVPNDMTELGEGASLNNNKITQGVNSWVSTMGGLNQADASHFGGPPPPDKDHTYEITLYALDKKLDIQKGFYLNELYEQMENHILDQVTLKAKYKKN